MLNRYLSIHVATALTATVLAASAATAAEAPHGGQMSSVGQSHFEVVFRPLETRVYLYDASNRPVSARGVTAKASLTVDGKEKVYQYDLKYAAPLGESTKEDHLALAVNVSKVPDGRMQVKIELAGQSNGQEPTAAFTQTFALAERPISVVATADSDQAAIAKQETCPVMDAPLGSMGTPVKVLVGEQPVFLCCIGCLSKIQKTPETYAPAEASPEDNRLVVSSSTSADAAAIAKQRLCAVANSRLGGMGTPVKVTRNGQDLFLCCKGCVGRVEKNPEQYFAKAAELSQGK